MSNNFLIFNKMQVENANALAGLTWGFPAISHFLGFVHALSRKLPNTFGIKLNGCAVVCHKSEVQAYRQSIFKDYSIALTRNPHTTRSKVKSKEAESPSFQPEGRMRMSVSLVIPIEGKLDKNVTVEDLIACAQNIAFTLRLAGGGIINMASVKYLQLSDDYEISQLEERKAMRRLLPGFALVDRSDLLNKHLQTLKEKNVKADLDLLDAWLDFSSLKSMTLPTTTEEGEVENSDEQKKVRWDYLPKPESGWIVPITIGYRGISNLYKPGEVVRTRDTVTPFRFVESVYGLAEWKSLHRAKNLNELIWRYSATPESGWYLCKQQVAI